MLREEVEKNRGEKEEKEKNHQSELKEKFISENLNDRILNHERIKALENELMEEVYAQYEDKF